jgi:hypothetical protein
MRYFTGLPGLVFNGQHRYFVSAAAIIAIIFHPPHSHFVDKFLVPLPKRARHLQALCVFLQLAGTRGRDTKATDGIY